MKYSHSVVFLIPDYKFLKMKTTIIDFLKDLEQNNNREWFQANKARYDEGKKNSRILSTP